MKRTASFLLITITAVLFAAGSKADKKGDGRMAPRLLNYQGFLTDTLGNPVTNPSVSMTFSIYDAVSSGSQKWTEDQSSVGVSKGIFNVLLGGVNPIPDSVFKTGADRWLELSIAGQALSPRTRIVSVPFAYSASFADTALYAYASVPDSKWNFLVSDGADTTLQMGGLWGLGRYGNILYGNTDSTHVNLGVGCVTGTNGQNYKYITVSGGLQNIASHRYTTIGGGTSNTATDQYATVGGGTHNNAGFVSTIGGGWYNTAGNSSSVGGGQLNSATSYGSIGGGQGNLASGYFSTISGGGYNRARGQFSVVAGGGVTSNVNPDSNSAIGNYSVIGGGYSNIAGGLASVIGGGYNNGNSGDYSAILGGYADTIFAGANYSYIFGINSNLTQDSTFMVDLPHVWFGTEVSGYEFPYGRGTDGQIMVTNGSGLLSWGAITYVDSARVAANAHKLQGKDTADFNVDYVNEGQVNSITNSMLQDGAVTATKIADTAVTMPKIAQAGATAGQVIKWNGTAWQPAQDSSMDYDWSFLITDGADTTLQMGGRWGLARPGNTLFGNADSTHVNFGVACTTGITGNDFKYNTVAGGLYNSAANRSTVGGGQYNRARGEYTTVSGGSYNDASGWTAAIVGGDHNLASNQYAFVGGGQSNTASGEWATVAGGYQNTAAGLRAFVGGGNQNSAPNQYAVVAGGTNNSTGGNYATVGGGSTNSAIYMGTVAGGFQNNASTNATIAGGVYNSASGLTSTIAGGHQNLAAGTVAAVGGGRYNKARGAYSVVSGGGNATEADSNSAIGNYSAIGGGYRNIASGNSAIVAGGYYNSSSNWYAVVSGGQNNTASGQYATVAGGEANAAVVHRATVSGGAVNYVAGEYSAIPGGYADTIFSGANYSYLFGINSNLTQDSTFMVDLPHIRFGTEAAGYEFPVTDGSSGQALVTDGSGQVSWASTNDNDWTISGNNMYSAVSGNVGIGTTTPSAKLNVWNGNISVSNGGVYSNTGYWGDAIRTNWGNDLLLRSSYSGKGIIFQTQSGEKMRIDSDGNVGIGVISPGVKLDVAGSVKIADGTQASGYVFTSDASGNGSWQAIPNDNDWTFRITDTADTTLQMGGRWGLARPGNTLYGNADSTHVNLAVGGVTGTSGQDYKYCTVGGGYLNTASGDFATVDGGRNNTASGWRASIGGGWGNTASNYEATVGGGTNNNANGNQSVIAGGGYNLSPGTSSAIGGGYGNNTAGTAATVAGGQYNTASGSFGTVAGGGYNKARGEYSTVGGGGSDNPADSNSAIGNRSVISGGYHNIASGNSAVIGGGFSNIASYNGATVAGGTTNTAGGDRATVGGGNANNAGNQFVTIGGGTGNNASGNTAAIVGGNTNTASGEYATVGAGVGNTASGNFTFIGGGWSNRASGNGSIVTAGYYNSNAGDWSVIPGGYADTIFSGANYSYLFGINSNLTQDSTFMVDLPHIRFGTEAGGYEFPTADGSSGQVLVTDGSGQVSWGTTAAKASAYTPAGSSDTNGNTGDISWDDGYVYVKTSAGWKRAALSSW